MIRLPSVEDGMERSLVVEVAVAAIDWEPWRRNRHQHRARAASDDFVALAGGNHDHLVAEERSGAQLGFYISAHTATGGRVKGANVGDPHR